MVLDGVEMGGGSIRIHRKDIQEKVFEALGFTMEEAMEKFGFFLEAFSYGAPPHGGLAFGLDRMIMLLCGTDNIREVIAFPKIKDASCLMSEAPSTVDEKQLEELHLMLRGRASENRHKKIDIGIKKFDAESFILRRIMHCQVVIRYDPGLPNRGLAAAGNDLPVRHREYPGAAADSDRG